MPLSSMPPNNQGGAPSPAGDPRDHFAEFVNKHSYIPVWLHPDIAHGVIRHFGKAGHAIVHPHPSTGYVAGGVVASPLPASRPVAQAGSSKIAAASPAGAPPVATRPRAGGPLAGLPPQPAAAANQSIFGGGQIGAAGPTQQTPIFAQRGRALDGRAGTGKVPGRKVPAAQKSGHDTVHAMLDPGEAVFNQKQLAGIKVKPGKENLVRSDQKKAMNKASKNATRK